MALKPARWERQPNESPEAFHAFTLYRDGGPKRSLDGVSRALRGEGQPSALLLLGGKPASGAPNERRRSGRVSQWSRDWDWVERAAAWDSVVDTRVRERQLDDIERMARRQAQHAELMMSVLMRPVVELAQALQDPNRAVALATAPIGDLYEMALDAAAKLPRVQEAERLARGVRVLDAKDKTTQGGTALWHVDIHQPPREGPEPDLQALDQPERPEWEGDARRGTDDED